ncbi:MAG: BrnT family toxin, partial [Chloroflexota bacterium]
MVDGNVEAMHPEDVPPEGFAWDPEKALLNRENHGVGFRTPSRVFDDDERITRADLWHSDDEERRHTVGWVPAPTWDLRGWYLFVVWTMRGRLI